MGVTAQKRPRAAEVPMSVYIRLAQDPEGFEREIERYAEAEAKATAAEAKLAVTKAEREAFEREKAELAAERADIEQWKAKRADFAKFLETA